MAVYVHRHDNRRMTEQPLHVLRLQAQTTTLWRVQAPACEEVAEGVQAIGWHLGCFHYRHDMARHCLVIFWPAIASSKHQAAFMLRSDLPCSQSRQDFRRQWHRAATRCRFWLTDFLETVSTLRHRQHLGAKVDIPPP